MKWFQVDADTPNDPKIRAVVRELELEGIGGLFLLWCFIADHGARRPGWSIDSSGRPIPLDDLRDATKLDQQKFDRLVTICVESGHFEKRPWNTRKVIAIPAMATRADTYTRRRVRTSSEHSAESVPREFANKTTHTKTAQRTKEPPVVPLSGGHVTRADRKQATQVVHNRMGRCPHEPQCASSNACIEVTAREIHEKAVAS